MCLAYFDLSLLFYVADMFSVTSRESAAPLANVYFLTSLAFQFINAAAAEFINEEENIDNFSLTGG
jgi:hypothetical protein